MSAARLRAAGALAALALAALPAAASAHPGVYTLTATTAPAGVTYPTTAGLGSETQYAIANDGWALGLRETNGLAGSGGMINYKTMPGTWRVGMTSAQKLHFPAAQTGVQAHATCQGVAALQDDATVLAWQSADPFYAYIPWQKTSASLGDVPDKWIPVVKAATGVDLSTLTTVGDFTAACAGLGGTYVPADVSSNISSANVAAATAPLNAQIATLQSQLGTALAKITRLEGDNATLAAGKAASDQAAASAANGQAAADGRATEAEAARLAQAGRPLTMKLATRSFPADRAVAMVTGPAGTTVTVTGQIRVGPAATLGLSSRVVARATTTIDASGAALVTLRPSKLAVRALRAHGAAATPVTVIADSGASIATASATITR
jgi:hypothetical protein